MRKREKRPVTDQPKTASSGIGAFCIQTRVPGGLAHSMLVSSLKNGGNERPPCRMTEAESLHATEICETAH